MYLVGCWLRETVLLVCTFQGRLRLFPRLWACLPMGTSTNSPKLSFKVD